MKQNPLQTKKKIVGALFLCQLSQSSYLMESGKKLLAGIALCKALKMW